MADKLTIHYDSDAMNAQIQSILNKVERPKDLMVIVRRSFHAATMEMFKGVYPSTKEKRGVKWPKLKESTIDAKRRLKKKGKLAGGAAPDRPMVAGGDLRDSLKPLTISDKGFTYGTTKKSKKGFDYPGHWNFSKFPFLFIDKLFKAQTIKSTIDFLKGKLKNYRVYSKRR